MTLSPIRMMLDSNVHDLIAANPPAMAVILSRIRSGHLTLITTHVQRDELSQAPDQKRQALMEIYDLCEVVPTAGAIWDVSRWDEATWGTDKPNASMDALMGGNPNHAEDALIASSTHGSADILVTSEIRLASKIRRAGWTFDVWNWSQFLEWLES